MFYNLKIKDACANRALGAWELRAVAPSPINFPFEDFCFKISKITRENVKTQDWNGSTFTPYWQSSDDTVNPVFLLQLKYFRHTGDCEHKSIIPETP